MSIIYDALKKTQQQRHTESRKFFTFKIKPRLLKKRFLVIAISAVIMAVIIIHQFNHSGWLKSSSKKALTQQSKKHEPLILNGVFLSNNNKVAMINQKMYALGESIHEMKVEEINEDNIKLRNGNNVEVLSILGA